MSSIATFTPRDETIWEHSLRLYNEGAPLESLYQFVRYLAPSSLPEPQDLSCLRSLVLTHGSVRLHLTVENEKLTVRAPVVRLPSGGRAIALMRKALTISANFNLASFRLEGEVLTVRYQDAIDGCHPSKLLDMISCICRVVDLHDDLFCESFGAEPAEPITVETWSGELLDQADRAYRQILDEGLALADYWDSRQNLQFSYLSLELTSGRLFWALGVKGFVSSELARILTHMQDGNIEATQRLADGRRSFEALRTIPTSQLSESLYDAQMLIPTRREQGLESYQSDLKGVWQAATNASQEREYDRAASICLHCIYDDLGNIQLPPPIYECFVAGLERAAGLSWREASEVLIAMFQDVLALSPSRGELANDYYRSSIAAMPSPVAIQGGAR